MSSNIKILIHKFVQDHCHPTQSREPTIMLASHKEIIEVHTHEIALVDNLRQKSIIQPMRTHADHRKNLEYIYTSQKKIDQISLYLK